MRFQLLRGSHKGQKNGKKNLFHWNEPGNNVIETDVDLVKKFNKPGCRKFARIASGPAAPVEIEEDTVPEPQATVTDKSLEVQPQNSQDAHHEFLRSKTVAELVAYAKSKEIGLAGVSRKDEIIDVIMTAETETDSDESEEEATDLDE